MRIVWMCAVAAGVTVGVAVGVAATNADTGTVTYAVMGVVVPRSCLWAWF
jgi:hypothetical protein